MIPLLERQVGWKVNILGVCHDVFICSACVLIDGEIVAAIPEERLDRSKRSRVFPTRAIQECLRIAGLDLEDIDEIAIAWNPAREAETTPAGFLDARRWRSEHLTQVPSRLLAMSGREASSAPSFEELWEGGPRITFVDHYLTHAANGAFLSPFETSAVLVVDGRGEIQTGMMARASGAKIEVIGENRFPHSLGLLYGAVTQYLGFKPDSDEWKVMALASYADAENQCLAPMRKMVRVGDGEMFSIALEYFEFFNYWDKRMFSDQFVRTFGEPRAPSDPITERHEQIAAALQQVFEESMTALLIELHERTGLENVVVNGGSFMNSVFNGKIEALTPFKRAHIGDSPDDSGTSIGAALYVHALRTGRRPMEDVPQHNYWGTGYTDDECLEAATAFKLPHTVVGDPSKAAAQDLVDGKLIGWFQGRGEFGQRALGNRSILVDPRRPDAKDLVNSAVKFREPFRPFAPAILAERVAEYFDCPPGMEVPYMERVYPFKPDKGAEVPAVVHVDGSGRLGTVGEHASARFRALIEHFSQLTGVPIVLNTSFNLNGEPIVNSPVDAIRTFYSTGLDVLYLGSVRVSKEA